MESLVYSIELGGLKTLGKILLMTKYYILMTIKYNNH